MTIINDSPADYKIKAGDIVTTIKHSGASDVVVKFRDKELNLRKETVTTTDAKWSVDEWKKEVATSITRIITQEEKISQDHQKDIANGDRWKARVEYQCKCVLSLWSKCYGNHPTLQLDWVNPEAGDEYEIKGHRRIKIRVDGNCCTDQ